MTTVGILVAFIGLCTAGFAAMEADFEDMRRRALYGMLGVALIGLGLAIM